VVTDIVAKATSELTVSVDRKQKNDIVIQPTAGTEDFQSRRLGKITLSESGVYTLQLTPVKGKWKAITLRSAKLIPAQ